jgi:tetratricopeptide (TPR) repeat protein
MLSPMRRRGGDVAVCSWGRRRASFRQIVAAVVVGSLAGMAAACGGSRPTNTTTAQPDYGTLIGAGVHLLRAGNVGAAEQLFEQAIKKNPRIPVGYYDLGVALEQQGQAREAGRMYMQALRVDPAYVPALYNEAVLLGRRGSTPTAIFLYQKIITIKPDSPTALLNLGLLEASQGGLEREAYVDLTHAIRLDPALRAAVPAELLAHLRAHKGSRP